MARGVVIIELDPTTEEEVIEVKKKVNDLIKDKPNARAEMSFRDDRPQQR